MPRHHFYHRLLGREFTVQPGFPFRHKTPYALPAGTRLVVTRICDVKETGVWAQEPGKPGSEFLFAGSYVEAAISKEERRK